ncbi:MAG TPA: agmatine deiminase family protein, partial [Prolixibacteraceae bacterium]|nr:agmatine deiminase family protein [Prolixibacteraceae bacterium]
SIPKDSPATSGEGIYVNFLLLEDIIIMPGYKNDTDEIAAEKLKKLYHRTVKTIKATELAKQGGMINCVTWTK